MCTTYGNNLTKNRPRVWTRIINILLRLKLETDNGLKCVPRKFNSNEHEKLNEECFVILINGGCDVKKKRTMGYTMGTLHFFFPLRTRELIGRTQIFSRLSLDALRAPAREVTGYEFQKSY